MPRLTKLSLIAVALVSAITLALLSVCVERIGPDLAVYGNLWGQSAADPCYKPVLKGGFPAAYLVDAPGISVERQLAFGEDELSAGTLALDIAIYFALILLAMAAVSYRRSAPMQAASARSENS